MSKEKSKERANKLMEEWIALTDELKRLNINLSQSLSADVSLLQ
ncbi:MAG: hypothetical protein OSA87_03320 [Woeseiaceae bacterium]|nr:hypothetical protein [Woeseiaceae bacterium]